MRKQNMVVFALMMCVICAIFSVPISAPFDLGWVQNIDWRPEPNIGSMGWELFAMAVIFAPLFETLLFQALPMWVLWNFKWFRKHRWVILLISGVIFGVQHFYSLQYILLTTMMGAIMMWGYIIRRHKHAFWSIALFHCLWNFTVSILQLISLNS